MSSGLKVNATSAVKGLDLITFALLCSVIIEVSAMKMYVHMNLKYTYSILELTPTIHGRQPLASRVLFAILKSIIAFSGADREYANWRHQWNNDKTCIISVIYVLI